MDNVDCMNCKNELKLCKLCAEKAHVKCLSSDYISTDNACVAVELDAKKIMAESINSNSLCSRQGTINSLCVDDLSVSNFKNCVRYRAFAEFAADSMYVLGSNINFDTIFDDPNGNVSLAPFSYTIPVSGYYIVSVELDQKDLVTTDPILGVPTSHITIYINGILSRDATVPFLTFSNQQKSNISSLLFVNAGDIITAQYYIEQLTNAGISPVVGSVTIQGGLHKSLFGIHYLSSLDCSPAGSCQQCPNVTVMCRESCCSHVPTTSVRRASPISRMSDDCDSCQ